MEQYLIERIDLILDRLNAIEQKMDPAMNLPEYVVGYPAVADLLEKYGTGSAMTVSGIRSATNNVRFPVDGRVGNRPRFKVADVLEWDKMGRPNVSEMKAKNI